MTTLVADDESPIDEDAGPPESAADVELRGVSKRFGEFTAVDAIDLSVRRGEFISLLGPSGCGKTTTLRLIAGFEEVTSGSVIVGGESMAGVPPYRRDVNTVFQQYALFPHMSVLQNVGYGLKQRRVSRDDRDRRAREALHLVGLTGREASRPEELSGGQQQRVALARALVMRPRVLLLDEPLGALDLKLRKAMQIELKRIQREVELTFIFVTHDQDEAMTMSDRIAVLNAGRIEQLGRPADIYDRPATAFVADFIGEMNRITARLVEIGDERWAAQLADGTLVRGKHIVARAQLDEAVDIGVRPEWMRVDAAGANGPGQGLTADFVTRMILGHQVQSVVRVHATGQELLVRQPRAGTPSELEPTALPISVSWPAEMPVLMGPRASGAPGSKARP